MAGNGQTHDKIEIGKFTATHPSLRTAGVPACTRTQVMATAGGGGGGGGSSSGGSGDSLNDQKLAQFISITGAAEDVAKHYLEVNGIA